jgi:uncharacterized protein (DUF488 family)
MANASARQAMTERAGAARDAGAAEHDAALDSRDAGVAGRDASVRVVATIGYELATVPALLAALTDAGVEVVVDVRAVAGSRRPGFAKTKLAANLEGAGIAYLHLRGLGTPANGRAAARAGRHDEMRRIFAEHLAGDAAQADLLALQSLVRDGRRVCLLCLEADPAHCHRSLVAAALAERMAVTVRHLSPAVEPRDVD